VVTREDERALGDKTIADFGDQWLRYRDNSGYYGSTELLEDILGPLLAPSAFEGKRIADIGSGTGRIVQMLLMAGASHVLAVEPSKAVEVLRRNVGTSPKVEILQARGDHIPSGLGLDFVVSIGVLHHIPEPNGVMRAAYSALKPGGHVIIWVYGREGNRLVVMLIEAMRFVTTRLPHWARASLAFLGTTLLHLYIPACRLLRFLPMADYMRNVIGKFDYHQRYLVIYDQLNPAYAKYYTEPEVLSLLEGAGFTSVKLHHRHRYSWTAIGLR
jgi:SAM-dependent methyltransferase